MSNKSKGRKKKIQLIHIGKKCPKGFVEVAGSMHLGKGIWALKCEEAL